LASPTDKLPEDSEEGGEGAALIGSATVRAPGVCGELVQGVIEGIHFLVTCPVARWTSTPGSGSIFMPMAPALKRLKIATRPPLPFAALFLR